MIQLTRLDGTELWVNSDLILTLERTPDTMVTMTNGVRILVKESIEAVVERAVAFRCRMLAGPEVVEHPATDAEPDTGVTAPPGSGG
jgi:flagellar protein FlbD